MDFVEETQINYINSSMPYSIAVMSLAALCFYLVFPETIEDSYITAWLAITISVDVFRILSWLSYKNAFKAGVVDYVKARRLIFIGTVLSGLCWGGISILFIPLVDVKFLILIMLTVIVLSTGFTTTLSYRYLYSYIFVLLALIPLTISIQYQTIFIGDQLIFIEIAIFLLILFLLKNTKTFHENCTHMIHLQQLSHEREDILTDQTKKAEAANIAKSLFLAKISHELRTPMHAILAFSSLGASNIGTISKEKIAKYFSRINESGQRLLSLLNDLLDLAKLEAGRMNFEFSQNDMVLTIEQSVDELEPLFNNKRLTVNIQPTDIDTQAIYDKEKIYQVVRNLIVNAIEYSPEESSVSITITDSTIKSDGDKPEDDVPAISVSVADEGVGIPEDELEIVFDEFMQSSKTNTSAGGTGLGLSICREIIKCHGGVIKAESIPDSGVLFTFSIPYKQVVIAPVDQ